MNSRTSRKIPDRRAGRSAAVLLAGFVATLSLQGQTLPVEVRQQAATLNYLSPAGVPISTEAGDPPGSDGRMPTPEEQAGRGLTENQPTTGQFQGAVSQGAVVKTAPVTTTTPTYLSYEAYALEVLPHGGPEGQEIFFARTRVGAPYISRQLEFLFGSRIPVPEVDAEGVPLAERDPAVEPRDYWLLEPWWPEDQIANGVHEGAPYYWSPHARSVFANRPGPIEITWRRAQPLSNVDPLDYANDPDFAVVAGQVYPLLRQSYLISGSPVKSPRRMYWTEGSFQGSGIPVGVPEGITVNFVFTDGFPKNVEEAYQEPGASEPVPPDGGEVFTELRTIFYDPDRDSIRAFNWQGRILLELLGDVLQGNRRQYLGTEIIDVVRRVNPDDVTVELGEQLRAFSDPETDDSHLVPQSLLRTNDSLFAYQHFPEGERTQFYAIRETTNLNDFLLHWTEAGIEGLLWPERFVRYRMVWPDDISKYSHYMRPRVEDDAEAQETAVEMPLNNVPIIEYQDALDRPRAQLTETFAFYTHLDEEYPAHRTLLRFMSEGNIAFERVFSWLADDLALDGDGTLRAEDRLAEMLGLPAAPGTATEPPRMLTAWDPETGTFELSDPLAAPRVVNKVVEVGDRIEAPLGDAEPLPGESYWAGHIRTDKGTSYHPGAYVDPFTSGFEEANAGAIIPVNAIPGDDLLEVWWFRSNEPDLEAGFERIYWPSVIGRYTLTWPVSPEEIVLASLDGSGALPSLQAAGSVYVQNDPQAHGYNPNEEHALMIGGQVYALRDDLNLTDPGPDYSSDPFVLLDYEEADGRPAMLPFRVLREKPAAGMVFDYVVEAGTPLQAPMPLPLLPAPVDGTGADAVNFNTEPRAPGAAGDLPGNWDDEVHGDGPYGHYPGFTFLDRKDAFWVYRGRNAGPPALEAGTYDTGTGAFTEPVKAVVPAGGNLSYDLHVSQRRAALQLRFADDAEIPLWISINGLALEMGPPAEATPREVTVPLVLSSIQDGSELELSLVVEVVESGPASTQGPLVLSNTNPNTGNTVTFVGRPPYIAEDPAPDNSFTMRFYYKTRASFAWPGMADPPAVDSIVPYLRPRDGSGDFIGDPADKNTASQDIVYRPVWPVDTPGMRLGDTLLTPKEGLPAVRGQTSLQVLYQQSVAEDIAAERVSAILHDPTREKEIPLEAVDLEELPAGVRSELYQGREFFPDLPPHLVERFFFDPFRGANGHLVFAGEFKDEVLGADYLLLNVLRGDDLQSVKDLCPDGDPDKQAWDEAVDGLVAEVETFMENPEVPNTWIPDPEKTVSVGIGDMVEVDDDNTAVDSYALSASGPGTGYVTLMAGGGEAFSPEAEPVALQIIRIEPEQFPGALKVITPTNPLSEKLTLQHTPDLAGRFQEYEYDWRIAAPVNGLPPVVDEAMSQWSSVSFGAGLPRYTLGGANIRTLSDNYLVVRYRPLNPDHPLYVDTPTEEDWSDWTSPMLAEGWIKRVLAGINPFNQRITDLFNNEVSTDVSLLTQAGPRWEGDIALNLENINDFGLIEIYETVLRRGRALSIDAGINYGPANDALLLAAGYLNDLYMVVGNEAWADAANPTIGIGTADETYGDIATSLFSFRGQLPNLLEEELALLRGRDDFLLPGTEVSPVYNRLIWNYTRGIDAGEVIYATNYNIQEKPDGEVTGTIDASDAARMYPQGHGDAYGHYLTALKGYYSLFMNSDFDWVPRIEAVLVLNQPVSVDYLDERKFAAAANALARAGQQVFDLTWRRDYREGDGVGWQHLHEERTNDQTGRTRHWGMDHWATRTGQGAYVNWVIGNAILPAEDTVNEGIQKIDRTTVTELSQMPAIMDELQTSLTNAEGGLTPLGLSDKAIAFDIDPNAVANGETHFEQIYDRALTALNNAVAAFNDAKDVTRILRSEQDSLAELQANIARQEHAYRNSLLEIYGSPYPDSIGPGRTYATGYDGPDLLHFMYVDLPELPDGLGLSQTNEKRTYRLDIQGFPDNWREQLYTDLDFYQTYGEDYTLGEHFIEYELGPHGFFDKPDTWEGTRRSPGKIQQAISERIAAHQALSKSLASAETAQGNLEKSIRVFNSRVETDSSITEIERGLRISADVVKSVNLASEILDMVLKASEEAASDSAAAVKSAIPTSFIAGLASGGDVTSAARAAVEASKTAAKAGINASQIANLAVSKSLTVAEEIAAGWVRFEQIENNLQYNQQLREQVASIGGQIGNLSGALRTINQRLRTLDDAERKYRALLARGDRIREEREIFRRRSASIIQGFRTRDAAFRIFRNEKLERYKTLFDLAARYTYLAAQAYDYETGLLNSDIGQGFIERIIGARALGVMSEGEPQFAGSNTGDPGLSSVLAEMKADWSVLKGRLGFNNPDTYGTTFSLRGENFRIQPGDAGRDNWKRILEEHWVEDIRNDPDVRRYALQSGAPGTAEPGLVIPFSTIIESGNNFFGRDLLAGDSAFSPTSFATKVFAAGIALPGYIGMTDPATNTVDINDAGADSPDDPEAPWLHPDALAATPYVYLLPVGEDSMRSPPLGDQQAIRSWDVQDVTVPLPFNVGGSDFSTLQWWRSSEFLTGEFFGVRKHQAFRPVSGAEVFSLNLYGTSGYLEPSPFTNNRLIGRSVWNSEWKLVIPGSSLLSNPKEGLRRFIRTVQDIQLHLITYSYSGN